jgi:DNA-binding HxlR family transcriptional regulator
MPDTETQSATSRAARPPRGTGDCPSIGCAVEAALDIIGGKWKGVVLFQLLDGKLRFTEIKRKVGSVTQRSLTKQLRELEADGVVTRTVHAVVPPKVEYELTAKGQALAPILLALRAWGSVHVQGTTDPAAPDR